MKTLILIIIIFSCQLTAQDSTKIASLIEKYQEKEVIEKSDTLKVVDLNTATVAELRGLKDIGDVIAKRILLYREGLPGKRFENPAQLINVKGIGEYTLNKIWKYVKVITK